MIKVLHYLNQFFAGIGGESAGGGLNTASLWNPQNNNTTPLSATLNRGRAWHTATVLPDGDVLIIGGLGNNKQVVSTVELYDPATQAFTVLPSTGVTARARHTVTVLSDGHVLIAGGVGNNDQILQSAELWDALDPSSANLPALSTARSNHVATLLPDGKVMLWGGTENSGKPLTNGELFDPAVQRFTPLVSFPTDLLPKATDVPNLIATYATDAMGGIGDLIRGRNDMIDAATTDADQYFHCRANCEASRRGLGGFHVAVIGSAIREIWQNEPAAQRAKDEAANAQGQCAGKGNPNADCYRACANWIPPWGIPQRHLPSHADPNHIFRVSR